jgi:eukaryotic-like serine/threonine-protein kinase
VAIQRQDYGARLEAHPLRQRVTLNGCYQDTAIGAIALGSEHPDTMASAADLALAYQSQGKFAESEHLAGEALEFNRRKQPDDWQRFRAESLLGASLAGQKKYPEAEPLLLKGYRGMLERKERIAVPDWYHLDRAREWIVRLVGEICG